MDCKDSQRSFQNADDAHASVVRFQLGPTELLATHNGDPVRLSDVLAFATPWLTTKFNDADATGRFGIGLSTLRSLSNTLEVHCAPYHVRIGDPRIAPIGQPEHPPGFCEPGWTTLRVPVPQGTIQAQALEDWFSQWDDSALLFLRSVSRVTLLDPNDGTTLRLEFARHPDGNPSVTSELPAVSREHATASDGRSWTTYSADIPTPPDVQRTRKATGATTPIAVAFPSSSTEMGQVYAGLPVAPTRSPHFVNAQFDPLTSRGDLADTAWNKALVDLVADVWSEAVVDLIERDPRAAWRSIPLPRTGEGESRSLVIRALEDAVLDKARRTVASRVSFRVREQERLSLS